MKLSLFAAAVLPLASAAFFSEEQYKSGEVMARMMERKEVRRTATLLRPNF